jgi:type I restriction enzyme R subunit
LDKEFLRIEPVTDLHQEHHFEREICESLAAQGWFYAEGDAAHYDRETALYLPDLIDWIQTTQPDSYKRLLKSHGDDLTNRVAERVRKSMNERGTLDVLRRGVEMLGLREPLMLVQFKPAFTLNPTIQTHYEANRLRVVRQIRHSTNQHGDEMDLVLFVNGVPTATVELKSDFTQSVGDAVDQYRFDRNPHVKGGKFEPLLSFPSGALVHFAVSQSEVMMTTELKGAETRFLPFNLGNKGGAGNPPNPNGYATSYLWEEVWARESWLEIIGRYLISKRNDKKQIVSNIFPRYHQLDATRKLIADVLALGAGQRYLIQHSAGSGKTNSIAWTAHFLADLHGTDQKKLFDSVIVVSDRTVLDSQLQEAIFDFERTTGVVETITDDKSGSKSKQLSEALHGGKKIIVCTIQTFPFALQAVRELSATEGKRFAVIADEAHSSQTGDAAAKLKQLLSAEEIAELQDGGEISTEDLLAIGMEARAGEESGLTYVAFTATPKAKTLELFGRKGKGKDAVPEPFHVYSMRQAIDEGFILDVLRNYTTYKLAFKLANNGKEYTDLEVEKDEATKQVMQWVRLHPYNISQKVKTVVEHFRENVQPLLDGKAKAMVVVSSRKEAVRWQKAMTQYIQKENYPLGVLVAFSGEIDDPDSYPEPVTEVSKALNPALKGRDLREVFKDDSQHLLIVANKFQTGFDQPLLCGMYVDKKLGGIQAVQTLSRLNRAYPNKDTTYILDFINESQDILIAFKTYYETATLEANTDPELVFTLRSKLDQLGYYDQFEVERVVKVELNPNATQRELSSAIMPVADRLLKQFKAAQYELQLAEHQAAQGYGQDDIKSAKNIMDALMLFKGDMGAFNRLYAFLSQITDYGNTDIEKRFIFFKRLIPLLEFGREREGVDTSKLVLSHHNLKNLGKQKLDLTKGETPTLDPMTDTGSGQVRDKEREKMLAIIAKVNGLFEGGLSENDQLVYVNGVLKGKLLENPLLIQQAKSNSKEQFSNSPDLSQAFEGAIMDAFDAHTSMSSQALASQKLRKELLEVLLGPVGLYEALRD